MYEQFIFVMFSFQTNLPTLLGCGGSTHKARYPCPFCACPNGQLCAPAPYRCDYCIELDELMKTAIAKDESGRSEHEKTLLNFKNHFSRACRHHDFLDSEARSAWKEKLALPAFKDIVKVIFPNESSSALKVGEWRALGELLEIDESSLARNLGRGNNRKRSTLDANQWTQAIKNWKMEWDVTYKNLDDPTLPEERVDKVEFSNVFCTILLNLFVFKEFENQEIGPVHQS